MGLNLALSVTRAALTCMGVTVPDSDLLGFSGAAFRVYWRGAPPPADGGLWDPSAHQVCAFDALTAAAEPFGWRVLRYDDCAPQVARQLTLQSLSRATPVITIGPRGEREAALIAGAQLAEGELRLLVRHRHAPAPETIPAERLWPKEGRRIRIGLLDRIEGHRIPPEEESLHRALRRIVWLARQDAFDGDRRFLPGERAYAAWLGCLCAGHGGEGLREAGSAIAAAYDIDAAPPHGDPASLALRHIMHGMLDSLVDGRRRGIEFLETRGAATAPQEARTAFSEETCRLEEAAALWPRCIERRGDRFVLSPQPSGFDRQSWLEETARHIRLAGSAYAAAVAAVEAGVPPTEQELLDPEDS